MPDQSPDPTLERGTLERCPVGWLDRTCPMTRAVKNRAPKHQA
jgi:hypothetical protein